MREIIGSIWVHYPIPGHVICLTTNGTVKKNGEAVMGRGNAKQATICIPNIQVDLGKYLKAKGNVAGFLFEEIFIFPVKHKWWEEADLGLIRQSGLTLGTVAMRYPETTFHLPRPGCGNGKRDWDTEVKPLIQNLPDNVWVHHLPADGILRTEMP